MTRRVRAKIWITSLFLFLLFKFATAQDGEVIALFHEPSAVEWTRTLHGTINDHHSVDLRLGFDGYVYRGIITYGNSLTYEIEGELKKGRVIFQEVDDEGEIYGFIAGDLEEDRFSGQWWSVDTSRALNIRLFDDGLIFLKTFEPELVEVSGTTGGQSIKLILQIESPKLVSGVLYINNTMQRIEGRCVDPYCEAVELTADGSPQLSLLVKLTDGKIEFSGGGRKHSGKVSQVALASIRYDGQLAYDRVIDHTYPIFENENFNKWLGNKFHQWKEDFPMVEATGHSAEDRWKLIAPGWTDIFICEDDIISGMITLYEPGSNNYKRESFVYDIDEGRSLKFDEISKGESELFAALREAANEETEFDHCVLTELGFALFSDFDAVEGDAFSFVPFDRVSSVLRKRGMYNKLAD